jgi:hypothetical protein
LLENKIKYAQKCIGDKFKNKDQIDESIDE